MKFRTAYVPLALLATALAAPACVFNSKDASPPPPKPPPLSSTLATSAIWASMSAQSDGTTTKIYAAVLSGSDFVKLDGGDVFTAQIGGGEPIVLSYELYETDKIHYVGTFPADAQGSDIVLALHRGPGMASAPSSTVHVPAPFAITSPPPSSIALGQALTVSIAPPPPGEGTASDFYSAQISGDCLEDGQPTAVRWIDAVAGTMSIDTSTAKLKKGASGCNVDVQIRHETRGVTDPAFEYATQNPVEGLLAKSFTTALVE